jgi:uncharacterized DUF497 family protein
MWTTKKNKDNRKKHGFYLEEIVSVFDDPHGLEFYDRQHSSIDEERYIFIGRWHELILCAITTDRADGNTQIISARKATAQEQEAYYEHYKEATGGNKSI